MSRCFPFPPPGYEKKTRIEDLVIPKKEKHKKKRKKEKRDHKEKGKSRNRDKRDNEKDRVKDKARTSDEAKLPDRVHSQNRQLLIQKDHNDNGNGKLNEKKYAGHFAGYGESKANYSSSHLLEKSSAFEIVPELPRRIRDGDNGSANLLGGKLSVSLPEKDDWLDVLVAKVTQNFDEGKTNDNNKESHEVKYGDRGIREESKFSYRGNVQPMVKDRRLGLVEKHADTVTEGKKWKRNGRDEKSKDKEKDKPKQEGKAKDKERERNKKKDEIGNLERAIESYEDNVTSPDSIITSQLHRDSHKSVASLGRLVKRKEFEANGILHRPPNVVGSGGVSRDISRGTHKLARTVTDIKKEIYIEPAAAKDHMSSNSSSDLPRANYKMLKSCQSSVPASSNWQVHSKPPHPDLEYLSQVYLVPKMEEWSDFCDQDWLYSSNASKLKKLKAHRFEVETTPPHVWEEAMPIDSMDIYALPYVVPY